MLDRIQKAVDFLSDKFIEDTKIGIVLGSGLGGFEEEMSIDYRIDYEEIPHFPVSTVEGHQGKLLIGKVDNTPVIALQGRFHYYEGYPLKEATFPIRVFQALGIHTLLLSNASGGLNPNQKIGDLMIIDDHIHLFPDNPLRGKNIDELGPRFPDMSEPYCKELQELASNLGEKHGLDLGTGVYAGTPGPTYESKAEYKYFRYIGADAVGMSTTAETIVAIHAGMRVFGVSIIADMGVDGQIVEISHDDVQKVAKLSEPKLRCLFREMVKNISHYQLDKPSKVLA